MSAFLQICFYFIIVLLTFLSGIPLSLATLEIKQSKKFVPLTFLFGGATLIFLSFWMSFFGLAFQKSYLIIIFMIMVLVFISIKFKSNNLKMFLKDITKDEIFTLVMCFAAGGLTLIPIVIFNAQFPYGDEYTYICIADYLTGNGYRTAAELNPFSPWLTQMAIYQHYGFRIGGQMLLAFFTSLFHRNFSLELYAPTSGLSVMLLGCSVWFFVKSHFNLNKYSINMGVIFSVFNAPILIWCALFGFLPQIFGMAYILCAITMFFKPINWEGTNVKYILLCITFCSILLLVYSEMAPFLVLGVIVLFAYEFLFKKSNWKQYLIKISLSALGTIIVLGPYFISAVKAVLAQLSAVVGWNQQTDWWGYLGYLLSSVPINFIYSTSNSILFNLFFTAITLAMLGLLLIGAKKLYKDYDQKEVLEELIILSLPYFVMLIYFTSFSKNPFADEMGNNWSIYKLVQYYFVILVPFIGVFFSALFQTAKRYQVSLIIILTLFVAFNYTSITYYSKNLSATMKTMTGNEANPIGEYYTLYEKYRDTDKPINLIGLPDYHRKMVTYMLKDKTLISNWSSDGYFSIYGEIPDPVYSENGITLMYDTADTSAIANLKEVEGGIAIINMGNGFYNQENDGTSTWNWSHGTSELSVTNIINADSVELSFQVGIAMAETQKKSLSIYDGDLLLYQVELSNIGLTPILLKLDMKEQKNKLLKFVYDGQALGKNEHDSRDLYFGIWNMEVKTK